MKIGQFFDSIHKFHNIAPNSMSLVWPSSPALPFDESIRLAFFFFQSTQSAFVCLLFFFSSPGANAEVF